MERRAGFFEGDGEVRAGGGVGAGCPVDFEEFLRVGFEGVDGVGAEDGIVVAEVGEVFVEGEGLGWGDGTLRATFTLLDGHLAVTFFWSLWGETTWSFR